jgi:hypothetical protein
MRRRPVTRAALLALLAVACSRDGGSSGAAIGAADAPGGAPTAAEARAIAKEAYIYGFPLVDSYRIVHTYFVNTQSPEYKGEWNVIHNSARVNTPEDKTVQTPNSDTPYSLAGLDLRAEPIVLTLPPIERSRYYSVQLVDAYTHNFAYLGTRTTGNGGGDFLIAGPAWQGETPAGIEQVVRAETDLVLAVIRTQLFAPSDLAKVKAIQSGYKAQPLSAFLGQPAKPAAPPLAFPAPLTPQAQVTSPEFFGLLAFVMGLGPEPSSERDLRARFARLGIEAGRPFDAAALAPGIRSAVDSGMADAWKAFEAFNANEMATDEVTSGDMFGTREHLKGQWLYRMAAAKVGIFGNSKEEAIYPVYGADAEGAPLDGSTASYTLRFAPGQLPPVDAFWSLTLYEMPASLLSPNALDRYLINSPMLPSLRRDADGGVTLHIQHESPGKAREANWLPAPAGPFILVLRLYLPQAAALEGRWTHPPLEKVAR